VVLQLQSLPCSEAALASFPGFKKDNCPVLVLVSFPIYCDLWDGEVCAGPVPVIFSTDPEAAVSRLKVFIKITYTLFF